VFLVNNSILPEDIWIYNYSIEDVQQIKFTAILPRVRAKAIHPDCVFRRNKGKLE